MEFGAEIWGWREWREVEAIQERIRWTLGVDWYTPGYGKGGDWEGEV